MYHHFIIRGKNCNTQNCVFLSQLQVYNVVIVMKSVRVVIVWLLTNDSDGHSTVEYVIPQILGPFRSPHFLFLERVTNTSDLPALFGKVLVLFSFFFFSFLIGSACLFLSINKMVADKYAWSWHIMFEYLLFISSSCLSLMTLHSFLPHTLLQILRKISNAFLIFFFFV